MAPGRENLPLRMWRAQSMGWVGSRRDFYLSLWRHEPGEPLTLEVMRDNKVRRFEVKGGDRAYFFRQL